MAFLKLCILFLLYLSFKIVQTEILYDDDAILIEESDDSYRCLGKHRCHNTTTCLDIAFICDEIPQCKYGDDENDCETYLCSSPNYFKCNNGKCISSKLVCDNVFDCEDHSDEEFHCVTTPSSSNNECESIDFKCSNGNCIPKSWVCDENDDCEDGSDEKSELCVQNVNCDPITDFLCRNHRCIPRDLICDGTNDCGDNSDEESCHTKDNIPMSECLIEHEMFKCQDGLKCIEFRKLCDHKNDCLDGSDESLQCRELCNESCHNKCTPGPQGPICYCPMGTTQTTKDTCIDINECNEYGICDQKCNNTYGSYSCYCEHGFTLQSDGRTCTANEGEAILFFSTYDEVKSIELNSNIENTIVSGLKHVAGVNYDGEKVYWSTVFEGEESIIKSNIDGSKKELVVSAGLGSPEDISVDWITKNVYFSDIKVQHIGVCDMTGEHCVIIVNYNIDKPRGITVLPPRRIMFWCDWGKSPMIAISGMDGSNSKPFVKDDLHWPNDLVIDYTGSRLYWIDAKLKKIDSITLDGTDRRTILSNNIKHPFSIAIFENTIYWSEWVSKEIMSCNKFNGRNRHIIKKEAKENIYGIHVYHPTMHQHSSNPCASNPCSDICLLSPNSDGFTCMCPQEKIIQSDSRNCESRSRKPTLVLGQGHTIMMVGHQALGKQHLHQFNLKSIRSISALAYDVDAGSLIISDVDSKKISYLNLDTGEVSVITRGSIDRVTAMAYDNLGYNLYWCDTGRGTLEVMNFHTLSRMVLLQNREELPIDIALMPKEGFMFVAFVHKHHSHIDRIRMDGSLEHRTHVVETDLIGHHISLHYDEDLDRIFWADSFTGSIESTDSEGLDRHSYISIPGPMGLATVSNDLFWTSYKPNVNWGNKYSFDGIKTFPTNFQFDDWNDMDYIKITAVKGTRYEGVNPCADLGGCSDICLLAGKTKVCACPEGKKLSFNSLTCEDIPKCLNDQQYQCNNGQCISLDKICNGYHDCTSGQDEDISLCTTKSNLLLNCTENQFGCWNGEHCIDIKLKCNNQFDCEDRSDEFKCKTFNKNCNGGFDFLCESGECISKRFLCDKEKNCKDGSDENPLNCKHCSSSEFRCTSGSCIPKFWECDGSMDCTDGSDEHEKCDRKDLCLNSFTCTNGKCVPFNLKCDGLDDCGDRSDEQDCLTDDTNMGQCLLPHFQCTSLPKLCLPPAAKCNGTRECFAGEDEIDCGKCDKNEFECKENHMCIPGTWVCDEQNDCDDMSDESSHLCSGKSGSPYHLSTTTIKPTSSAVLCSEFTCNNGKCLLFEHVCDKHPDCGDGSDEGGHCSTSCVNGECDGLCTETPKGPLCHCEEGYMLSSSGRTCVDINECAIESICAQNCINLKGSYECNCVEPDFLLRPDHITCKAVGPPMETLYVLNDQLRQVSSTHLKVLFDYPGIKGFDIDIRKGIVYFSSSESGLVTQFDTKTLQKKDYIKGLNRPEKITLDWIRGIIYIVDSERRIIACHMENKACVKIYSSFDHIHISAILVDPINGYLVWCETSWLMWENPVGILKRSDLSGANVTTLIEGGISHVTSIAINDIKKTIFWSDQAKNSIEETNFDGSYRKKIINDTKITPLKLVIFEDNLYYVKNAYGAPFIKCNIYGNLEGTCEQMDIHVSNPITDFTISQISRQRIGPNKCLNSSCSHLCLESTTGPICLCFDGTQINTLQKCESKYHDLITSNTIEFRKHMEDSIESNSESGSGIFLMIGLIFVVLIVAGIYNLCLRKQVSHLVPKIQFRNPIFGHTAYSDRDFRHLHRPSTPPSLLLPTSPMINNLYETVTPVPSVQFKYANEMSIKHGEKDFWKSDRRNSDTSGDTDYAELQDNMKKPLI